MFNFWGICGSRMFRDFIENGAKNLNLMFTVYRVQQQGNIIVPRADCGTLAKDHTGKRGPTKDIEFNY